MRPFAQPGPRIRRAARAARRWTNALNQTLLIVAVTLAAAAPEISAQASTRSERSEQKKKDKAAIAHSAVVTSADTFEAFRTIGDRNIFDPNRVPRTRRDTAPDGPTVTEDVISFVGTMQSEKGLFAFFDGTDPRNRKALPSGAKVGDFTVAQIYTHSVEMTKGERQLTLRIGESLRRREGGEWILSTVPIPTAETAASAATSSSRPPAPTIPSDASATLRRLMEMRQKQLKE